MTDAQVQGKLGGNYKMISSFITATSAVLIASAIYTSAGACTSMGGDSVPNITISNGRAYIAAKITSKINYATIKSDAFMTTPAVKPNEREFLARGVVENGGEDKAWSVREYVCREGNHSSRYPVIGIGKFGSSNNTIIAAMTQVAVDLEPNKVLVSTGFEIRSMRPIKAGDVIPTVILYAADKTQSVLSIEAAGSDKNANVEPLVTIFRQGTPLSAQNRVIEAWRAANASVHDLPPIVRIPR